MTQTTEKKRLNPNNQETINENYDHFESAPGLKTDRNAF